MGELHQHDGSNLRAAAIHRSIFQPGSSSTLADQLWFALPLFSFPDYIGYCTTHRENDPTVPWADKVPGVINAHAQALHFVAMMRDAARLKGDTAASDAWRDRLVRFHRGSKAMFDLMHPGTDPNNSSIRLPGLMNYGVYQQHIHNTHAYAYSALTYGGLPLGYLQAGEYELELIEANERVREAWKDEDGKFQSYEEHDIIWPLTRTNPLSLSFIRKPTTSAPDIQILKIRRHGLRATYLVTAVSLTEVRFGLAGRQTEALHDPALYIHDGLGRYVLTNARFLSDSVTGAWGENSQCSCAQRFSLYSGSAGDSIRWQQRLLDRRAKESAGSN